MTAAPDAPRPRSFAARLARLVWLCALPTAAVALLPLRENVPWPLDLAAHCALPCALALAGAAVALLLVLRIKSALLFAAIAVVPAGRLWPLYAPRDHVATEGAPRLRAAVVNAFANNATPERVRAWLEQTDADVFAVLEYTPAHQRQLAPLLARWPHVIEHAIESPFGIALFSKRPLRDVSMEPLGASWAQAIFATIDVEGRAVAIAAVHPPPPMSSDYAELRDLALEQLATRLQRIGGARIVLGDLNATRFTRQLARACDAAGLRDSAEGHGYQGSWPVMLPRWLRIPIDHVLVSKELRVLRRELGSDVGSDHLPVVAEVEMLTR